jgi:O-antigen ligase
MTANDVLFRLLALMVLVVPVPLGSDRPVAWAAIAVWVALLMTLWALLALLGKARIGAPLGRLWLPLVPFALALAWAAVQASGWTPEAWSSPVWREAEQALGAALARPVSVDPALTWTAIMRCLAYVGVFLMAAQLGRRGHRAETGLTVVAVATGLSALWGLGVFALGNTSVLWFPKWAYEADLTGTFVNRNAFGAYLGLGVIACLGLAIGRLSGFTLERGRARDSAERLLLQATPWLLATIPLGVALLLTHSRGAFLATVIAAALLLLVALAAGLVRAWLGWSLLLAVSAVAVVLVLTSGEVTLTRLIEQAELEGDRGNLYRLVLRAIEDSPWLGWGFGAFQAAFRVYRDLGLPRPVVYDFAHSVPLELALDLGLIGAGLFALGLLAAFGLCVVGVVRRRRNRHIPAVALAALLLVSAHGLVDFSAQNPAVAVTLAFLLGLGVAQSASSRSEEPQRDS